LKLIDKQVYQSIYYTCSSEVKQSFVGYFSCDIKVILKYSINRKNLWLDLGIFRLIALC